MGDGHQKRSRSSGPGETQGPVRLSPIELTDPAAARSWSEQRLHALSPDERRLPEAAKYYGLIGLSAFWLGDFTGLDEALRLGEISLGEGPWDDELGAQVVLQRSLVAVVASLRGLDGDAEAGFSAALEPLGGPAVERAKAITYSLRAALASDQDPSRALDDVGRARAVATGLDDRTLLAAALIGEGWALSGLGRFDEAIPVLESAASGLDGRLERSVAHLRLAEVHLRRGDRVRAREYVDLARNSFVSFEARYWAARAALVTGSIDRDRGGRWLRMAKDLSLEDPAYERLFLPDGILRIDADSTPSVSRDGEPIAFLTRHAEAAVSLLAHAGPEGMTSDELFDIFWPSVPSEKQMARLRTLLWQIRGSLGADAWRLQRKRNTIFLDVTGVELAGSVSRSAIAALFNPPPQGR